MPSGVEHTMLANWRRAIYLVKNPLMPSGVEHQSARNPWLPTVPVKNPLMPSGVEHIAPPASKQRCDSEESFDAVRR